MDCRLYVGNIYSGASMFAVLITKHPRAPSVANSNRNHCQIEGNLIIATNKLRQHSFDFLISQNNFVLALCG